MSLQAVFYYLVFPLNKDRILQVRLQTSSHKSAANNDLKLDLRLLRFSLQLLMCHPSPKVPGNSPHMAHQKISSSFSPCIPAETSIPTIIKPSTGSALNQSLYKYVCVNHACKSLLHPPAVFSERGNVTLFFYINL